MCIRMLQYRHDWRGGLLIEVGPHYTSQKYPKCGFTHALNGESQSRSGCINPECNHTENADLVASKNIKLKGQTAPDSLEALERLLALQNQELGWREPVRISALQGLKCVNQISLRGTVVRERLIIYVSVSSFAEHSPCCFLPHWQRQQASS